MCDYCFDRSINEYKLFKCHYCRQNDFKAHMTTNVLDELQKLNRFFKSRNINERVIFIENRIKLVGKDLENSEQKLKLFREQNRQISSPSLQLQEERLTRNVEIQKEIYLTLKQQMELANIEKIQKETIIQILDEPQVPLNASVNNLMTIVIIAGLLGFTIAISLGFFMQREKL